MVRSGTCLRGRDGRDVFSDGKVDDTGGFADGLHVEYERKRGVKDDGIAFGLYVWISNGYLVGLMIFGEESRVWFKSIIWYPGGQSRRQVNKGTWNPEERSGRKIHKWESSVCRWDIKSRNWMISLGLGCRGSRKEFEN